MSEFQVQKNNLTMTRVVDVNNATQDFELNAGDVLLKVDSFAFTSNNITYGVTGDMLGYWQFFPAADNASKEWGILPVWGFADVVESSLDSIPVGERLFGYFPPVSFVKMAPVNITPQRLFEGAQHRSKLPPGYNSYQRVSADPTYAKVQDNQRMLLYPLHLTSFCIWDSLQENAWHGAEQVLIISASSKTSIGLAYALLADNEAPKAVALTSERNLEFVDSLELYDESVSYDNVESIDASIATVIVDMSGNAELNQKLRAHLNDNLKYTINVGLTHWDEVSEAELAPSDRSEFFFAPGHIQKRMKEWGATGFAQKSGGFLQETATKSQAWLKPKQVKDVHGLSENFKAVAEGHFSPAEGLVVKM